MNKKTLPILIIAGLLSIPFIAMQFTNEVNWDIFDFMVAGIMFTALVYGLRAILLSDIKRKTKTIGIALVLLLFLLIWAEMAVGIFNSPIAGS